MAGRRQRVLRGPGWSLREEVPGELEIIQQVLTDQDRMFWAQSLRYLGLRRIHVQAAPRRVFPYAAYTHVCTDPPRVVLGEDWPLVPVARRRQTAMHEMLHMWGLEHERRVHFGGSTSTDQLSPKLVQEVLHGVPRFVPEQFGITPDTFGAIQRQECPLYDPRAGKGGASAPQPHWPWGPGQFRLPRADDPTVEVVKLRRRRNA